jgi:hypothetical protein
MGTCHTTQHNAALLHAEEWILSSQKNFALPGIASRLQGAAYCFSVMCDWTLEKNSYLWN